MMTGNIGPGGISRRQFVTGLTASVVGGILAPRWSGAETAAPAASPATVVVVRGTDPLRMLRAGIARLGGWARWIKPRAKVVLKPNAAWAVLPEEAGNTDPALVEACIRECLAAGAGEVVVPEKPCAPARDAFARSGIGDAVSRAGGRMYEPRQPSDFRRVPIPAGVRLKEADVVCDVLDADVLINMPVAKSHGAAKLTLSMKNWMGSVADRGFWHKNNLHQCIADCSTLIKPSLVVVDAQRIMVAKGPRGPGPLEVPHELVFSTDPVAADAYAATLFKLAPFDVPHVKLAHEMGVGCGDLDRIRIDRLEV